MPELKLTDGKSPVLFTTNGYKLVVMPMLTSEVRQEAREGEAEGEGIADEVTEAEPEVTEPEVTEPETTEPEAEKPKGKRSRAKEPATD
jgi:DNA polymerase-3 subunit beta